jgi:hypothetical protein
VFCLRGELQAEQLEGLLLNGGWSGENSNRQSAIASTRSPPQMFGVPYHRFKVGQTVAAPSGGPHALIPRGVHVIVRLLPLDAGDPQYRILSKVDGLVRVVRESQIVLMGEEPKADKPPPPRPRQEKPRGRSQRAEDW